MAFVQELKLRFVNFLLNKRIFRPGKLNSPLDLDKAKTVGIVYKPVDQNDENVIKALQKELSDSGKTVFMLAYYDELEPPETILKTKHYLFLTPKDLNLLEIPKKSVVGDFLEQDFDIVMTFCFDQCMPLYYLTAVTKADFKLGIYDPYYSHIYDFMVQPDSQQNIEQAVHTLKYYLKSIHKN